MAGSRGARPSIRSRRVWVLVAAVGLLLGAMPAEMGGAIAPPPGTTKQPTKRTPVPPDRLVGLKSPKRPDPKFVPVGAPVPLGFGAVGSKLAIPVNGLIGMV